MKYHIVEDSFGDHREMLIVSVWDVYNYLRTSPYLERHFPRPDKIWEDRIPYPRGERRDTRRRANLSLREQFVYDTFRPFEGQKIDDGHNYWGNFTELWPGSRVDIIEQKKRLWHTLSEFTSEEELKEQLFRVQRGRVEICSIAILCACDTREAGVERHPWSDQKEEEIVFVPAGDPMRLLDKVDWETPRDVRVYGMNCESVAPNVPSEDQRWITRETNLATMDFHNAALGPPLTAALISHSRKWLADMVSTPPKKGETAADDLAFAEELLLGYDMTDAISQNKHAHLLSLLEAKADPDTWAWLRKDTRYGRPPTQLATQQWIDAKPDENGITERLWGDSDWEEAPIGTPLLTYAVSKGHEECIKHLLDHGANLYAQVLGSFSGATAMAVALNSMPPNSIMDNPKDWAIVTMLMNADNTTGSWPIYTKRTLADVSTRRASGQKVIAYQRHGTRKIDIATTASTLIMSLKLGRPMSKKEKTRKMLEAIVRSDSQCISLMLQAGVDPNEPHYFGNARGVPALASCFIRHSKLYTRRSRGLCAAVLLAHGADAYAVFKISERTEGNEDYTTMRLLIDTGDWINAAMLSNFCDPFRQIPEKYQLTWYEMEHLKDEASYEGLYYGVNPCEESFPEEE